MSKQTLQERFIAALQKRGEVEVKRTHKYVVYTRSTNGIQNGHYYIGKSGALRVGITSTGSVPVTDTFKDKLLAEVT